MTSNGYIDRDALFELRKSGKYKEAYEMIEEVHKEFPELEYVTFQYLNSLIDYKPNELDEIKTLSEELILTKYAPFGYYGLWFYYMSKNNLDEAAAFYEFFKKDSYVAPIYNKKLKRFKTAVEFRKRVFDVDFALEELESLDEDSRRYTFVTSDIADYYFDHEEYDLAIKYYKLSCDKRLGYTRGICFNKLGKCYHKKLDEKNAVIYYKKAVESAKTALESPKMSDRSKEARDEYFKLYYKYISDYIALLIDNGHYNEALENVKILEQGKEKDKCIAKQFKAKILRKKGLIDDAVGILKELLNGSRVDKRSALIELIYLYSDEENEKMMKKYLDEYEKEFETHHLLLLSYYMSFGYYEDAINHAKTLLGTDFDEYAKSYLGRVYNKLGNFQLAEYYLDQIVRPKLRTSSMFEIAVAKEKLGKFDEAYDAYSGYISYKIKTKDKESFNAAIIKLISMLNKSYKFNDAKRYIDVYIDQNQDRQDEIDYLLANYYYRKQDYENSILCFEKLKGTKYEKQSKNYLAIIYRYMGDSKKANTILDEIEKENSEDPLITLNRSKHLKDEHTVYSLTSAIYMLEGVKDTSIKAMVLSEQIPILIRLGMYDKALEYLEEAKMLNVFIPREYKTYKSYIYYRLGKFDKLSEEERTLFSCYSVNYGLEHAFDSIINMKKCNQEDRPLYMTDKELYHFFVELLHDLDNYDYYIEDIFDVYVIDMGKVIGSMFGIDTTLIEVKCEMDTKKIHIISPTLKRINVNKRGDFTRKKTD